MIDKTGSDKKYLFQINFDDNRSESSDFKRDVRESVETKQLDKLKNSVLESTKNWFKNSTFHGFSNLVDTGSLFMRFCYLILVSTSVIYCIYSIDKTVAEYLKFGVSVNYDIVTESPSNFPAITICNSNPFDLYYGVNTSGYIYNVLEKNNLSYNIVLNATDEAYSKVKDTATILRAAVAADQSMNDSQKKDLGYNLDTMLVSCYYNGIKCNSSNFTYFRSYYYGNCYTFNFDPTATLKTSKTGPESGLTMELYVGLNGKQDNYTMKSGIYVAIHNQTNMPIVKSQGFIIQTGVSANIAIERTFYYRLPSPFSSCRKNVDILSSSDSTFYRYTSQITKYTQNLCYEMCFQYNYAIPKCNCSDPSVPVVDPNQQICNTFTSLECIENERNIFDNSPIGEYCDAYCPVECDSIDYKASIASASYPTEYYYTVLSQQTSLQDKFKTPNSLFNSGYQNNFAATTSTSYDDFQDSLVQINVFYNDLRYVCIQETQLITLDTLVGLIGGFLALFMGASVISFIELLELLINTIQIVLEFLLNLRKSRNVHVSRDNSPGFTKNGM